jgi:chemotaxis protein MotB
MNNDHNQSRQSSLSTPSGHEERAVDVTAELLPRRKFQTKKGEALWLMSFSDLSMILLCFFILLLSYSTTNQKKADIVREAMQQKQPKVDPKANSLTTLTKNIEAEIKRLKLEDSANVVFDANGVAVEFKEALIFGSGSAETQSQSSKVVSNVLKLIAKSSDQYQLKIEGHTDDQPMVAGGPYKSNWELSSARGISLMRQFNQQGVNENRMTVVSYAQTRPKINPKGLEGALLQNARAQNRRVIIRIEPR